MQLLSDDGTNRTLLNWLKLWDKIVFDKELAKKPTKETEMGGADNADGKNFGNNEFKKKASNFDLNEDLDDSGRPQQKTSLLYGPPGLGKDFFYCIWIPFLSPKFLNFIPLDFAKNDFTII